MTSWLVGAKGSLGMKMHVKLAEELLLFDFMFNSWSLKIESSRYKLKENTRWGGDHINGAAVLVFPR